jgi:UDP-N-acetylmuramyl pentapeptide phosphotransferase/UDP-N-acetylglucosamine-1-phosphate transferase
MTILLLILSLVLLLLLLNYLFLKNNILIDRSINSQDFHKKFVTVKNNNIPLSGGLFFLISLFFLTIFFDPVLMILFSMIYVVGLLSDIHLINSAKTRIIFQFFVIFILVLYSGILIKNIRIPIFDYFLSYKSVSIIFTIFCLLILINGSNFIDGVNTLLSGYILLASLAVIYASYKNYLSIDSAILEYFCLFLIIFLIFNFFNKSFLGDSGAYLISSFLGYNLIFFFLKNNQITPYFIVVLLWYPAFENLFSISKRLFTKKKSYLPDNTHLHHMIFAFLLKKTNLKNKHLSTITGLLINFYNFLTFIVALQNINNTKFQVTIIIFNVVFYLIVYYFFSNNAKNTGPN